MIWMAEQAGITVSAPSESDIFNPPPLYGYVESTPKGRKLASKSKEMRDAIAAMEQDKAELDRNLAHMQGETAMGLEDKKATLQSQKQDKMKVENLDKLDSVVESTQKIAEASAEQAQTLADSLVKVVETLAAAVEKLNAPRTIVRDKDGRAMGVK